MTEPQRHPSTNDVATFGLVNVAGDAATAIDRHARKARGTAGTETI